MASEREQQADRPGSAVAAEEVAELRARLAAAERRLATSEQRVRQLEGVLNTMTDGVIVYDRHGNMLFTNPANRDILGSPEQWETYFAQPLETRLRVLEMRNSAGRPLPREQWPYLRVLRGESLSGERAVTMIARALDGQLRHLIVTGEPVRDEQGHIVGAVVIHRDVSQWHALEREVSERAGLLEAVLEAITDGIFIYDAAGRIVRVNHAVYDLFAVSPDDEFFRLSPEKRAALLHIRDEQGNPLTGDEVPTAVLLSGHTLGTRDVRLRVRDGRERVMSVSGAALRDETGAITGAVAVFRDFTERRRLEQRTHEALDALLTMAEALVQTPDATADEATAESSRAVAQRMAELTCSVLGGRRATISAVEPDTQLIQTVAIVGFTPKQKRQLLQEQQRKPTRYGEGAYPELLARLDRGEVLVLDLTQPPYNARPNPFGITTSLFAPMRIGGRVVGILTLDYGGPPHQFTPQEVALAEAIARLAAFVVERERLLRERAAAQAKALALEDANRRMDEFLSIASHELRTPLTTLKANLQLARRRMDRTLAAATTEGADRTLGEQLAILRSLLSRASTSSDRQERLVNDLLDVSRIGSGKLELRMEPCDLGTIVREAVDEQRLGHPERSITLEAPRGHIPIACDEDRIAQAVTNLLTNALKYSEVTEPVKVSVRLEPAAQSDARSSATSRIARVSVRDNGPGIPADQLEHIWEMFHRVPGIEVLSGSGVGLGLGLHISKTIVERHGGAVGVESAPGEGSTFWFTLPLTPVQE